jgi:hypothetical protein
MFPKEHDATIVCEWLLWSEGRRDEGLSLLGAKTWGREMGYVSSDFVQRDQFRSVNFPERTTFINDQEDLMNNT